MVKVRKFNVYEQARILKELQVARKKKNLFQRQFNHTSSDKIQIGTIPTRFEKLAAIFFTTRHKECVEGEEACHLRETSDSFQEAI